MAGPTQYAKEAIQRVLDDLPAEKIEEVLEFALFLKARRSTHEASTAMALEAPQRPLHALSAAHLDRLTGLVTWGGNALADSERLYDDLS